MAVRILEGKFFADNLQFSGFLDTEVDLIRLTLAQIYLGSFTGREMLDEIDEQLVFSITSLDIIKRASELDTVSDPVLDNILLNLNNVGASSDFRYIDQSGRSQFLTLDRLLVHELVHIIYGHLDNNVTTGGTGAFVTENWNFSGDTVELTNTIMRELIPADDWSDRTSYNGIIDRDDSKNQEYFGVTDYTFGNPIDETINDIVGAPLIDQSNDTVRVNELILALDGNDTILAGPGNDFVYSGVGADTLVGGQGNDYLNGADPAGVNLPDSVDTADYSDDPAGIIVDATDPANVTVQDGWGTTDKLVSIEEVVGSDHYDTLIGGQGNISLFGGAGDDYLEHGGFGKLDGGVGNDVLVGKAPILGPGDKGLVIDGSSGNDEISVRGGEGTFIFGGAGDDVINVWSPGTQIHGGDGEDLFSWSPNTIIHDAEAHDRVKIFNLALNGGVAFGGEDSDWAGSTLFPFIRYGKNFQGDLVINYDRENFFASRFDGGPNVELPTLGISVAQILWEFRRLLSPGSLKASPLGVVLGYIFKAMGILPPQDPLVLDLDGDGLEFTSLSQSQVHFDLDGDFFAEKTGWLRSDDGFLVMDRDGNGTIDDVSELFGAPEVTGFTELAAVDSNSDGVIDAADTDFVQLQVWRDLNQDGESDAGELFSLTEAGIVSISLATTAIDVTTSTDHHLTAQASFTRDDATTGDIYEAELDASQNLTRFLGDTTVSDWAAGLADVKGYGILTGLQLAASEDLAVAEALAQTMTGLAGAGVDLAALVAATEPLLSAWAAANPTSRELTPVLVFTDANGAERRDHGIYEEDGSGGYWRLASGAAVLDAGGLVIARPSMADVLAQGAGVGEAWRLEQTWSLDRGAALAHRPAAPYLLDAGDGQDVINDLNGNITLEHQDVVKFGEGTKIEGAIPGREGQSKDLQITFAGPSDNLTVESRDDATYIRSHNRTYMDLKCAVFSHGSDFSRRSWNRGTPHLRFGHLGQAPAPLSAYVQW